MVRGFRVVLDSDLAELYGVQTKVLNQALKRNIKKFPKDFLIKLSRN
ncbi:ORF6N domain-containing protein [Oceanipulchritudo coccoides]